MLQVITILLPIAVMIGVGVWCRASGFLTDAGIENIKKLVTKVILPVAIFHALSTAEYNAKTAVVVALVFGVELMTFAAGFLLRRFLPEAYGKYIPFMVCLYEGGMIAYPLYANLCGSENLSRMAMLDIPGLLFGFSVYMGLLEEMETGTKPSARNLLRDALRNPAFIASAAGVVFGLLGITKALLAGPLGQAYLAAQQLLTAPMTAMILLVVGYSLKPDLTDWKPCLQTVLLRLLVQTGAIILTVLGLNILMPGDKLLLLAVVIYMSAPATFSMQSFLRTRQASAYAAAVGSMYVFISIAVYAAAAVFLSR